MTVFWEEVQPGMALPELMKQATTRQLVQYAGASLDFYEIHYDKDFALASGLPSVVIHGALKSAWLAQVVMDWAGPHGEIKSFKVRYRSTDVTNDPLLCKGAVIGKTRDGPDPLIECEVWVENSRGQRTTEGIITLRLPTRS